MKVRCGFVTNSSSSSFILSFENKAVVKDILENEEVFNNYSGVDKDWYLDILLSDVLDNRNVKNVNEVIEYADYNIGSSAHWLELEKLLDEGIVNNWVEANRWVDLNREAFEERVEKAQKEKVDELSDKIKDDEYIVILSYSDEGGEGELEHHIVPELSCCKAVFNHH